MPAPSGPEIDLDVVELDIFRGVGRRWAGGGCRWDFGDAWTSGAQGSSLGFLEDGAGNREMLGFATGRIAFEGVILFGAEEGLAMLIFPVLENEREIRCEFHFLN